jgi:hypothetical protein
MKQKWGTEEYDCCNRSKRRGMALWRLGIWKLSGSGMGIGNGMCPLYSEKTVNIVLESLETKNCRKQMCK